MKQEDKELLIQDLCARLPYEVKININVEYPVMNVYGNYTDILESINLSDYSINNQLPIEEIKPYLFPIASMTEEQVDIVDILLPHEQIDWLNAHHFDFRDLIGKKLALDATGLNIY